MCLVVLAVDTHPRLALVLAANRDEYHARPAAPATWGRDAPYRDVLAGRDLMDMRPVILPRDRGAIMARRTVARRLAADRGELAEAAE